MKLFHYNILIILIVWREEFFRILIYADILSIRIMIFLWLFCILISV